jgi:hypothetical protein
MRVSDQRESLIKGTGSPYKRIACDFGSDRRTKPQLSGGYFISSKKSDAEIARQLNRANIANCNGGVWNSDIVHRILKSENYIGNLVHNRTSRRLGQKLVNNHPDLWVRRNAVIDPVVDKDIFARAQKIMAERRISIPEDQMLLRLRLLLKRKGKLSAGIIDDAVGVPSYSCYVQHFGTIRKAYAPIGYAAPRDCDWIDTRDFWSGVLVKHANQVSEALRSTYALQVSVDQRRASITIDGESKIFFVAARQGRKRGPNHVSRWRAYRRPGLCGLIVPSPLSFGLLALAGHR